MKSGKDVKSAGKEWVSLFSEPTEAVKDADVKATIITVLGEKWLSERCCCLDSLRLSNPAGPDAQVDSKREEERVEIACAKMGTSKAVLIIQNNESHRCDRLGKREAKDSRKFPVF